MRRAAQLLAAAAPCAAVVRTTGVPDARYVVTRAEFPHVVDYDNWDAAAAARMPEAPEGGAAAFRPLLRARRHAALANVSHPPHHPPHHPLDPHNHGRRWDLACAGTLIGPQHVITAAHCMCYEATSGFPLTFDGQTYTARRTHTNPGCEFNCRSDGPNRCDAEIIELDRAVTGVEPIEVWDHTALGSEEGHHIDVVGWGVTGDAATITSRECSRNPLTGDLRRGQNTVLRVTSDGGGGVLEYMMKRPADGGRELEGVCSDGDSGGPCFIEHGGKPYLAGTNSGWGSFSGQECAYGSIDQYCRISMMRDWIYSVVNAATNTSSK